MVKQLQRQRLETAAIVIGYAMSRLDRSYLSARGVANWRSAFQEAGQALSVRPASLKNLRDEFDPFHSNRRAGWHAREMRSDRRRVLEEMSETSDDALIALVDRIMAYDHEVIDIALDSLVSSNRVAHNVAERLLTGRRAEDYFLENSEQIIGVSRQQIGDYRAAARGFDFGVLPGDKPVIEVKGLKAKRGDILFTDHEWSEAKCRTESYLVVVVGSLESTPVARVWKDPYSALSATSVFRSSLTVSWRACVSVDETRRR